MKPPGVLRVVLASANQGKLADFRLLCDDAPLVLSLPAEHGVLLDVEETGASFADNAILKAEAACAATGLPSLADDSGLAVDALGGEPGIYSARYAGPVCDDHANNRKVIERLQRLEAESASAVARDAAFVCALALVFPGGERLLTEARCRGRIIDEERGCNGFGYDAIFFRDDLGCTFGEATPEEKNERSHRAAAVKLLLDKLRARIP